MTKERKKTLVIVAGCALGVLVVLVGGYMTLVSPKKARDAALQHDIAAEQNKLASAHAAARHRDRPDSNRASDLFRLSKAMPDQVDIAGAILDLNAVARASGVRLDGLTPSAPVASSGSYESVPIQVLMHGRYGQFTNFLGRLKQLVGLRHGDVDARGRLFAVDSIQFAAGDDGFPQLSATLQIEAYTYSPSKATSPPTTTSTDSSSGSTSVSAAGATH
jgi:Tfp pilus assembly protein PilO